MPTKWLQERTNGSKNEPGMPPHRGLRGKLLANEGMPIRGGRWARPHQTAALIWSIYSTHKISSGPYGFPTVQSYGMSIHRLSESQNSGVSVTSQSVSEPQSVAWWDLRVVMEGMAPPPPPSGGRWKWGEVVWEGGREGRRGGWEEERRKRKRAKERGRE